MIRQLARHLGGHHEALRNWIRQDEADRGLRGDRPTTSKVEELRRLLWENPELKRAHEILKAASAFLFSVGPQAPGNHPSGKPGEPQHGRDLVPTGPQPASAVQRPD
ncbi:transposase [Micromonospora sp. SH-82]|uniref:transposase n=1 Tax=Micromonospora sp. SH-82 TaxID=3132938 RepID=UPI003EB94B00